MKKLLLVLLLFSTQVFADAGLRRDVNLTHESVKRVNQLFEYFATDIYPLLNRYQNNPNVVFDKLERDKISRFWTQVVDHRIVLHALYNTYADQGVSYQKNLIRYSANLSLQISAAILSKTFWGNKHARKKLNETNIAQVPRGSFISLENELFRNFNKGNELELPTLFPVYNLEKDFHQFISFDKNPVSDQEIELESLNKLNQSKLETYRKFITSGSNIWTVKKRFYIYKFKNIFYELSRKISTWIGDTKVHRRDPDYYNGKTLIGIKLAKKMEQKVLPGDIMISRTNWFLSNAFLPGFWPHSFIYLGNQEKLNAYYNVEAVNKYFKDRCLSEDLKCNSLVSYLSKATKTSRAFKSYLKKDKYGFDKVLIESTSDGVHFSSIRHTFLNDYLGALRPTTTKLAKAKSIVDAIEMFGLEYDFNFDYHTDDRLVCSELLGKAYAPNAKKGGFNMNYDVDKEKYLEFNVGRLSLASRGFVRKAYDENVKKERKSELKFVAFLKGIRKKDTAIFSSEKDFYESKDWKKWSFMQD